MLQVLRTKDKQQKYMQHGDWWVKIIHMLEICVQFFSWEYWNILNPANHPGYCLPEISRCWKICGRTASLNPASLLLEHFFFPWNFLRNEVLKLNRCTTQLKIEENLILCGAFPIRALSNIACQELLACRGAGGRATLNASGEGDNRPVAQHFGEALPVGF